jgi:dihydroorotate dehydrogenase electron transfer subunit
LQIIKAPVDSVTKLENNILLLRIFVPEIAKTIYPGQFINIRVSDSTNPLLRRPFSVCDVEGDYIYILFNIYGEGTKLLSNKKPGDMIDLLGPLGHGFNLTNDHDTVVIAAGGIGSAPFPFMTRIIGDSKEIITFLGGRSKHDLITYGLKNILISTDDGSMGSKGNVVELIKDNINLLKGKNIKIFACGPNTMLSALKVFCLENNFNCEVSTECSMACGFGICQGCPIEAVNRPEQYYLVCKDGPVFNIKDIII